MKKHKIQLSETAESDLNDIWAYIAADSAVNAGRFLQQLETKVFSLETFPERNPLIPEDEYIQCQYRHLIFKEYRIIYRIENETVKIMRILNAAQFLKFNLPF